MLKRFLKDIRKYRNYLMFATKSQLRSEVANSYLDWVWWVLEPFCNMLVYTLIFGYIFDAREKYFPIFIFIGVSIWGFFSKTLTISVKLIKNNKTIITKVYLPKQILLLKILFVNAFKMLLSFLIIIIMMLLYRVPICINIVFIIPVFLLLFCITYGIGCLLMHYGVYIEDLGYIVEILLKMTMYFTGIFYSIENKVPGMLGIILSRCNPIAFIIDTARNSLLYSRISNITFLCAWGIFASILCVWGTSLIYKNENSYVKVI